MVKKVVDGMLLDQERIFGRDVAPQVPREILCHALLWTRSYISP